MFGSVFPFRLKPGTEEKMVALGQEWNRERRPKVQGAVASYFFKSRTNPGEWIGVAVFDSEENYRKNANDPEQHRWYERMRELMESDPDWNDGDVVEAM